MMSNELQMILELERSRQRTMEVLEAMTKAVLVLAVRVEELEKSSGTPKRETPMGFSR